MNTMLPGEMPKSLSKKRAVLEHAMMGWVGEAAWLLKRQFTRLTEEKQRTGSSIAELIRRAVDNTLPSFAVSVTPR